MKVPVDSQNQHRAAVCVLFPHLGRRRIVIVLYNLGQGVVLMCVCAQMVRGCLSELCFC